MNIRCKENTIFIFFILRIYIQKYKKKNYENTFFRAM